MGSSERKKRSCCASLRLLLIKMMGVGVAVREGMGGGGGGEAPQPSRTCGCETQTVVAMMETWKQRKGEEGPAHATSPRAIASQHLAPHSILCVHGCGFRVFRALGSPSQLWGECTFH
jgi:hypothetical protein